MKNISDFSDDSAAGGILIRLDTHFIAEMVELEVDKAVSRLFQEKGLVIDAKTQRQWCKDLYEVLVHTMQEEAEERHILFLVEIQEFLRVTLVNVIDVDTAHEPDSATASLSVSRTLSPLLRRRQGAVFFRRKHCCSLRRFAH